MLTYLDLENRFGDARDIWLALSDLQHKSDVAVLSRHEQRTYRNFDNKRRKQEFLEARAVLKDMAFQAGFDTSSLSLKKNENGRPFGVTETGTVQVSIAHSNTYVLCGLSKRRSIGVDLEPVDRVVHEKLRDRIFTDREKVNDRLDNVETLRLWTVKEAIVKLIGEGLGRHLSELSVDKVGNNYFVATVFDNEEVRIYSWKYLNHWIAVAMYRRQDSQ